jgi:cobalt-zinc-cadmium efflux system outer membrane protein
LTLSLSKNPDLARWATEMVHRQAVIDHEVSKAIPDITLSGGYRRLEETNDNAAVVGISIPLQVFNRNQGAFQAARHRLARIEAEKRAAQIRVNTTLAEAYNALTITYSQASSLKNEILPQTRSAFDAVTEGYRFGKFSFLEVLDSQRTLFNARSQYLAALSDYHKAVADVERVTGEPVAKFLPKSAIPEKETTP